MVGYDGNEVNVGWAEHEILWVRAAISQGCRVEDFTDIASISGRTLGAVRDMAYKLRRTETPVTVRAAKQRRTVAQSKPLAPPIAAPIRQLTPAELMAGIGHKRPSHFRDALRGFA